MKTRLPEPEDMDDPTLDPDAHRLALAGLARLNRISFSAEAFWQVLEGEYRAAGSDRWVIVDLATGGGDLPIRLARKAQQKGYDWHWIGTDISPVALNHAACKARDQAVTVEWLRLDATRDTLPVCDWMVSSLFLHHLDETTLISLLQRMAAAARCGILIDDLERTAFNRGLVWLGAHLLSRSVVVHQDSDRSVRAAFTLDEMTELARLAGLQPVQVKSRFPARFQLLWKH